MARGRGPRGLREARGRVPLVGLRPSRTCEPDGGVGGGSWWGSPRRPELGARAGVPAAGGPRCWGGRTLVPRVSGRRAPDLPRWGRGSLGFGGLRFYQGASPEFPGLLSLREGAGRPALLPRAGRPRGAEPHVLGLGAAGARTGAFPPEARTLDLPRSGGTCGSCWGTPALDLRLGLRRWPGEGSSGVGGDSSGGGTRGAYSLRGGGRRGGALHRILSRGCGG